MESGVSSSDGNDTLHSLLSCIHSLFLSTLLFPFLQERNCPSSLSSSTVLCLQRLLQLDPVDLPSQLLQLHALSYATQHAFPALLHSSFPARTLHFALERLRPFSRNTDEKVAIATLQLIRVCHSCSAFSLDRVTDLRTIFTWVVENEVSLPAGNEALSTVRVVLKKTSLPDLEGVLAGFIEWSFRFFSSLQPSSLQSSSLQSSSLQSSSLQSSSLQPSSLQSSSLQPSSLQPSSLQSSSLQSFSLQPSSLQSSSLPLDLLSRSTEILRVTPIFPANSQTLQVAFKSLPAVPANSTIHTSLALLSLLFSLLLSPPGFHFSLHLPQTRGSSAISPSPSRRSSRTPPPGSCPSPPPSPSHPSSHFPSNPLPSNHIPSFSSSAYSLLSNVASPRERSTRYGIKLT